MPNWLKHFDRTMLGLLFTDQHLSPSEIVRIARNEQSTEQARPRVEKPNPQREGRPRARLAGLR